eukprot:8057083-Ditylum_brightwellii.AAC.1
MDQVQSRSASRSRHSSGIERSISSISTDSPLIHRSVIRGTAPTGSEPLSSLTPKNVPQRKNGKTASSQKNDRGAAPRGSTRESRRSSVTTRKSSSVMFREDTNRKISTQVVFSIDPSILHFTSEAVADDFYDSRSIFNIIRKLCSKDLDASDLPRMCVYLCPRNNAWFTIHNSLLYCFQQAGLSSVEVCEMERREVLKRTVPRQKQHQAISRPSSSTKKEEHKDDLGCWIFIPKSVGKDTKWFFKYFDDFGEWDSGYEYPRNTKFVRDGVGGVWALCCTSSGTKGVESDWRLWHINPSNEVNTGFDYPPGCKM